MRKKRLFAIAFAIVMTLSLTSCADGNGKKMSDPHVATDGSSSYSSYTSGDVWSDPDVQQKANQINSIIDDSFYFEIDEDKKEEAVYDAIMAGLDDPYSVYYTPDEYSDLMEETSGEYVGIGAVVTQNENKVVSIVRPVKGSPAEEAGLMPEDVVIQVDDLVISDEDLASIVEVIRGKEGTEAYLKIYRPSENKYLEFNIPRRVVENQTVIYEMLEDNVGYIQVTQFYENTGDEFETAYDDLESQGMTSLIVDVRDNPGGLVTAVVQMCNYLMPEGTIVSTKDKNGKILQQFDADGKHTVDIPMVVLTNGNSASASEIFSGAMKDSKLATLVGTTTYGKGIVQSVIPLGDGSAVKLTVAKYFTPAGNDIHKIGIEPDYEIELPNNKATAVGVARGEDTQLIKAMEILTGKTPGFATVSTEDADEAAEAAEEADEVNEEADDETETTTEE